MHRTIVRFDAKDAKKAESETIFNAEDGDRLPSEEIVSKIAGRWG